MLEEDSYWQSLHFDLTLDLTPSHLVIPSMCFLKQILTLWGLDPELPMATIWPHVSDKPHVHPHAWKAGCGPCVSLRSWLSADGMKHRQRFHSAINQWQIAILLTCCSSQETDPHTKQRPQDKIPLPLRRHRHQILCTHVGSNAFLTRSFTVKTYLKWRLGSWIS